MEMPRLSFFGVMLGVAALGACSDNTVTPPPPPPVLPAKITIVAGNTQSATVAYV